MKKKYTFLEKRYGVSTKVASVIREWASGNGHEEVDSFVEADYIYDTDNLAYRVETGIIHKVFKADKAWGQLHNSYDVSIEELVNLFNQANSKNIDTSRLGLALLYRLRGDFYYDIQEIVRMCGFTQIKYCPEFEIYGKILNKSHNFGMYDPERMDNLPLTILRYISTNGIQNKEIAIPFFNWVFKEFSVTNNSTKIEITIK